MKHLPEHPGQITYYAGTQVVRVALVEDVPLAARYGRGVDGSVVPVVRVVATTDPLQRILREYGPDGELLRTIIQKRGDSAGKTPRPEPRPVARAVR